MHENNSICTLYYSQAIILSLYKFLPTQFFNTEKADSSPTALPKPEDNNVNQPGYPGQQEMVHDPMNQPIGQPNQNGYPVGQPGYPGQQEMVHDPMNQPMGQPYQHGYPVGQPGYPEQQGMQPVGQPYPPGYPGYPGQPGYYGQQGVTYDPIKQPVGPGVQGETDVLVYRCMFYK